MFLKFQQQNAIDEKNKLKTIFLSFSIHLQC